MDTNPDYTASMLPAAIAALRAELAQTRQERDAALALLREWRDTPLHPCVDDLCDDLRERTDALLAEVKP